MFDEMFLYDIDQTTSSAMLENDNSSFDDFDGSLDGSELDKKKKPVEFKERKVCIPYLMLLGLMYCKSNKLQRAEKFYELVEIELTNVLHNNDEEFIKYVPVMYEISYLLMFRLYSKHREPGKETGTDIDIMPELDIVQFLPEAGD